MTDQTPAAPGGLSVGAITPAASRQLPEGSTELPTQETAQPFGPTSGIGSPIPIPKKQTEWESGYQNEHGPRPSRWESWVAAPMEEAAHNTLASPWGGALFRMLQESQAPKGRQLTADEANALFPGRETKYTTPIDSNIVQMEHNDWQKQKDLADWVAQREPTNLGRVVSFASGFVGGLTDPLNFAIGMMSGGAAEALAPAGSSMARHVAAHYLANLGGFSVTDALSNLAEHQMGARRKQLPEIIGENAVPAAIMTGIGVGLGAVTRRWANAGGGTSEADIPRIKAAVAALEQDHRIPPAPPNPPAPNRGGPIAPLHESTLFAAAHSDGTPLVHEHGLGQGIQLTDSLSEAHGKVATSTETPGKIAETRLPEGSKLLDINQPISSEPAFVKAIEDRLGVPLDQSTGSLKEAITSLGDWAGMDVGGGKTIPENALEQIQSIAKEMGYSGYQFGENTRQIHLFDSQGLSIDRAYQADPNAVQELPTAQQDPNPATEKAQKAYYTEEAEQQIHEARKKATFDPNSVEMITEFDKDIEQYKKQLSEMAKESSLAKEALDELREQEAKDKRLQAIAKKITECGSGGGI